MYIGGGSATIWLGDSAKAEEIEEWSMVMSPVSSNRYVTSGGVTIEAVTDSIDVSMIGNRFLETVPLETSYQINGVDIRALAGAKRYVRAEWYSDPGSDETEFRVWTSDNTDFSDGTIIFDTTAAAPVYDAGGTTIANPDLRDMTYPWESERSKEEPFAEPERPFVPIAPAPKETRPQIGKCPILDTKKLKRGLEL